MKLYIVTAYYGMYENARDNDRYFTDRADALACAENTFNEPEDDDLYWIDVEVLDSGNKTEFVRDRNLITSYSKFGSRNNYMLEPGWYKVDYDESGKHQETFTKLKGE